MSTKQRANRKHKRQHSHKSSVELKVVCTFPAAPSNKPKLVIKKKTKLLNQSTKTRHLSEANSCSKRPKHLGVIFMLRTKLEVGWRICHRVSLEVLSVSSSSSPPSLMTSVGHFNTIRVFRSPNRNLWQRVTSLSKVIFRFVRSQLHWTWFYNLMMATGYR